MSPHVSREEVESGAINIQDVTTGPKLTYDQQQIVDVWNGMDVAEQHRLFHLFSVNHWAFDSALRRNTWSPHNYYLPKVRPKTEDPS